LHSFDLSDTSVHSFSRGNNFEGIGLSPALISSRSCIGTSYEKEEVSNKRKQNSLKSLCKTLSMVSYQGERMRDPKSCDSILVKWFVEPPKGSGMVKVLVQVWDVSTGTMIITYCV